MQKFIGAVVVVVVLAGVSACSSNSPDTVDATASSPILTVAPTEASAQDAAEAIQKAVPSVKKLIPISEDNDQNNLIGRPNGYTAAVVLVDSRVKCDTGEAEPDKSCGATIEQWPSNSAAEKRKKYIDGILEESPMFGSEYSTVRDNLLLRVSGELKPSQAKAYEAAFTS